MSNIKTELLAPAGSLDAAMMAYEAGSDAVYVGLEMFSARKSAKNFHLSHLQKLKTIADKLNKKIYVALNTIIMENELPIFVKILTTLELLKIDAVIVQDFALINLIRKFAPSIDIHASTQMAVHNSRGAKLCHENGIKRVVLSRELSFDEIERIKKSVPEIELEVFIHGAMCYSFSGLCLASGIVLDRSGNRGECAQICRNYFNEKGNDSHCFSMRDLALWEEVKKLKNIGINSLKIEGRMKSTEYIFYTSTMYRNILDDKPFEIEKQKSSISFSRLTSKGYFRNLKGTVLVENSYTKHIGTPIGKVLKVKNNMATLLIQNDLSVKDGLLFFINNDLKKPVHISVNKIENKNGKLVNFSRKLSLISVNIMPAPIKNQVIYQTSHSSLLLKKVNSESVKEWKCPININVELHNTSVSITTSLNDHKFLFEDQLTVDESSGIKDFRKLLEELFSKSNKSFFTCNKLSLDNYTEFNTQKIFVPPSVLKKIKNNFYENLQVWNEKVVKQVASSLHSEDQYKKTLSDDEMEFFSSRENISPLTTIIKDQNKKFLPFAEKEHINNIETLAKKDGVYIVPLKPIVKDSEKYLSLIKKVVLDNPVKKFLIGINNVSHLSFALELENLENTNFFLDFFTYIANTHSASFYSKKLKKLIFAYTWLEKNLEIKSSSVELITIGKKFSPPLFYSLACFVKHNNGGICPDNCPKEFVRNLKNNSEFKLVVKDCRSLFYNFKLNR